MSEAPSEWEKGPAWDWWQGTRPCLCCRHMWGGGVQILRGLQVLQVFGQTAFGADSRPSPLLSLFPVFRGACEMPM